MGAAAVAKCTKIRTNSRIAFNRNGEDRKQGNSKSTININPKAYEGPGLGLMCAICGEKVSSLVNKWTRAVL